MEILLTDIAGFVPPGRVDNLPRLAELDTDEDFLRTKIGTTRVARMDAGTETSQLCAAAFASLAEKSGISARDLDCLVVVTQNPDGHGIPHTSAVVHEKIGARDDCAAFDLSLGCSGFVYALSVVEAFMRANGFRTGTILTCDPYSKILEPGDRNTALLFGDAAAATLLRASGPGVRGWKPSRFAFATCGASAEALHNRDGRLSMDGRAVFNFSATVVPDQIRALVAAAGLTFADIDLFVFHQGSKFIVDTLRKRLDLPEAKVPVALEDLGNTVSSSIPLALAPHLHRTDLRRILLSGFGVGLSWASGLLERVEG
jgi:3-oxoacyl-[acyl-carrier-protein] synthase-3